MSNIFNSFFYEPILNLVIFIYNILPGHDLGMVIVILTIIIKIALYPLSKKAIQSQKALSELQPKIDELKIKYKDKKDEMGKAMIELYKENSVNPFSSCLPILLQLPFLWAVYKVFNVGFKKETLDLVYPFIFRPEFINNIGFYGLIADLSKPNIILAVLAGAAQFWQTKMMMAKQPEIKTPESKDENMAAIMNKQMLYIGPLLTVFIGASLPAALSLYWLVMTLVQAVQQLYIFRKNKKVTVSAVVDGAPVEGKIIEKK